MSSAESDLESEFDSLDKLLARVPVNRLQCPHCKNEDDFSCVQDMAYSASINYEGITKIITIADNWLAGDTSNERLQCGRCYEEFPFPDDWQQVYT